MINRREYEQALTALVKKVKGTKLKEVMQVANDRYNFTYIASYLNKVKDLSEASETELFWIYDCIESIIGYEASNKFRFKNCFSDNEIATYKKQRLQVENENIYPITFEKVIQVADDQWVTIISAQRLYKLYKAQAIRYNLNTQRPAKYSMSKGGVREYSISLNMTSVKEICRRLLAGEFIPNAITFNLNMDNPDVDWEYNKDKIEVYNGVFDIVDGYHRFRGVMMALEQNPELEFNFILNIMNFDTIKACDMIEQENERNPIVKRFSQSLDSKKPAYTMVHKLNDDVTSPLYELIGKDEPTKIDYTRFFGFVNEAFKEVETRQDTLYASKILKQVFNIIMENEMVQIDNEHIPTYRQQALAVWCGAYCFTHKIDARNMNDMVIRVFQNIDALAESRIDKGQATKQSVASLERFIEQYK